MENSIQQNSGDNEMQILKFMEVTECQSYEQAKFYVAMNNYQLKDAISAYVSSKEKPGTSSRSTNSNLDSPSNLRSPTNLVNNNSFSITPEEVLILQQRLRATSSSRYSSNLSQFEAREQNLYQKLVNSCKSSFKCFQKVKKGLKKKINSMKKDDERIFYFQELYHAQLQDAGFQIETELIQSFQLQNVQENQKMKAIKNQPFKPIFALVVPNRKSSLIQSFLKNEPFMTFIRQNFEIIFLTLSELREIQLSRNHSLRNIRKCPTGMVYMKNFYDLESVLITYEGEPLKNATIDSLKKCLEQVPSLMKKWTYLLQLQKQLKQQSITSLNQVVNYENDQSDEQDHPSPHQSHHHHRQHQQTKKSLIQQQTKIYEEMVAQQIQRKKSIELEKQKLDQLKELREVRKLSIPEEPTIQRLHESIEFRFRCPLNGEYITRRFLADEKVDILYQFVDTEPQRNFDLFTSFPPTSLSDKKDQLLKEVFDQQKENILIRQV